MSGVECTRARARGKVPKPKSEGFFVFFLNLRDSIVSALLQLLQLTYWHMVTLIHNFTTRRRRALVPIAERNFAKSRLIAVIVRSIEFFYASFDVNSLHV